MKDLVRRPFGFASAVAVEALTFTVQGNVSPTSELVVRDQLQLTRDEIRRQYVALTQTDVVWQANVMATYKGVHDTWWNVWSATPPYLLYLACLNWYQHVQAWHTEAQAAADNLWRFAAPIALKLSVEAAPQFSGWSEAFSFIASNSVDIIHRWKPAGGIAFLKYFEEANRAELPKGVAFLRGRGQHLDQRLRTIWAARASLLAYGVDQAMITPDLILSEIRSQAKARGESVAKFWTLDNVAELLEAQYEPVWSLNYSGEDDNRMYGETLPANADVENDFETTSMHQEAGRAARALAREGLWPLAMSLPLNELLQAAEAGTQPLSVFCQQFNLKQDVALEIVSHIGHLRLWSDI
ncbi:hypothetical protein GO986_12350 [Deinococcus sp. HMF7620]|uniref:Uncharacterized protein n=1 Tax=Deinococcus arboris TaxID=2682977 RepID=A0A7C9LMS0_9DEIO|nr:MULTISPECIES: hypothetical protein [Deinococcus]MBZ9752188.1 hypothetical protein [Deinococcus betulae]MVN87557.1 hypothetical protein [Deinococcus arboris]